MQLKIDPKLCTGCRMCEMECSFAHEQRFGTHISRVRVVKLEEVGIDYPVICQQCANASCIAACPVGALSKTEAGTIAVDHEKCTRCGACVAACPFGAMNAHPDTGWPISCDLCGGDPSCAKGCPTGAIVVEEEGVPAVEKQTELIEKSQSARERFVQNRTKKLANSWGGES